MFQLFSYITYLLVSSFITIYVGWRCYHHGFAYLRYMIKDIALCKAINKLLLTGYYLLNIGYIAWSLNSWTSIQSLPQAIAIVGSKIGWITLILCVLHYTNITTIYLLSKKNILHS